MGGDWTMPLATIRGNFTGVSAPYEWKDCLQPPPPMPHWRATRKILSQCFLGSAHWELWCSKHHLDFKPQNLNSTANFVSAPTAMLIPSPIPITSPIPGLTTIITLSPSLPKDRCPARPSVRHQHCPLAFAHLWQHLNSHCLHSSDSSSSIRQWTQKQSLCFRI